MEEENIETTKTSKVDDGESSKQLSLVEDTEVSACIPLSYPPLCDERQNRSPISI